MARHTNLIKARDTKNDEFYTQIADIERELKHYRRHFKGKIVFCNCDDPEWSNFWRYFHLNFEYLGLKKLISTHYDANVPSYKIEYEGGNDADTTVGVVTPLKQNGDFRSPECIELMEQADIICTNPPFSIAREFYIPQLIEYKKDFLIIGDLNWITYKTIFPLLKDNVMWFGYNGVKEFRQPDGTMKKFGNKLWFTNLDIEKRHENLDLIEHYNPEKHLKYDNYDAINVDKVLDIPVNYDGIMGVPITFMSSYNPDQFEIIGFMDRQNTCGMRTKVYTKADADNYNDLNRCGAIWVNGKLKNTYMRIFIRRRSDLKNDAY